MKTPVHPGKSIYHDEGEKTSELPKLTGKEMKNGSSDDSKTDNTQPGSKKSTTDTVQPRNGEREPF